MFRFICKIRIILGELCVLCGLLSIKRINNYSSLVDYRCYNLKTSKAPGSSWHFRGNFQHSFPYSNKQS